MPAECGHFFVRIKESQGEPLRFDTIRMDKKEARLTRAFRWFVSSTRIKQVRSDVKRPGGAELSSVELILYR